MSDNEFLPWGEEDLRQVQQLQWVDVVCAVPKSIIEIEPHGPVTFAELKELSELLCTDLIDLNYDPGSPGYSEWTPGDPASFCITVRRKDPAKGTPAISAGGDDNE